MNLEFKHLFAGTLLTLSVPVSAQVSSLSGNGTFDDPYLITSVDDLIWMRNQVNKTSSDYADKHFKLTCDLDFSGKSSWTPIGDTYNTAFKGSFYGEGYSIQNLKIGNQGAPVELECAGLFGEVINGSITDLKVEWDGLYTTYSSNIGGIAGRSINGSIINCEASGNIASNTDFEEYYYTNIGAIAGFSSGNVTNCHSSGTIHASSFIAYAGGIVGYNSCGSVTNCYTSAEASSSTSSAAYAGGIAGNSVDGYIANSYASGNTSATSNASAYSYAGGIVGYSDNSSIANSYTSGEVLSTSSSYYSAASYVGGVVGYATNGSISNNYAMNKSVVAVNSNGAYHIGRVLGGGTTQQNDLFADANMTISNGTSKDNQTPVADLSDSKNGTEFTGSLIDELNNYVTTNKHDQLGIILYQWNNIDGQNHPSLDFTLPSITFTLEGEGTIANP